MGRVRGLAGAVCLVLAAAAAYPSVDSEVPLALKAQGTLSNGSTDTWIFPAAGGTLLSFTIRAGRGADLDLQATLFDPLGGPVPLAGEQFQDSGKKLVARNVLLPASGRYRLEVSAEGSGDYALLLKGRAAKVFTDSRAYGEDDGAVLPFTAPPGSTVILKAKAARGSAAQPRFGELAGEDYAVGLSAEGKATPNSHAVVVSGVGGSGDLQIEVTNAGGPGEVALKIVVKAPKSKALKLDARGAALGLPGGSGTLYGRTVGPAGLELIVDDGGPIHGTGLLVPAGALASPTVITLASAPAPTPPAAADQTAGPAVDLRPSGLTFLVPVSLTLPFDLARVPADADPGSDLRILVREQNGSQFEVEPDAVDQENGTITVSLSGFSVCIPVVRSGTPRLGVSPGGDEYWLLGLLARMEAADGGGSRARKGRLEIGEVSFFGDGTVQLSTDRRAFTYENSYDGFGVVANLQAEVTTGNDQTTWSYGADGRSIEVVTEGPDPLRLRLSRDGSVAVTPGDGLEPREVELTLLVRKAATPPTLASMAGTWWVGYYGMDADTGGPQGAANLGVARAFGTAAFDGKGGVKIAASQRNSSVNGQTGAVVNRSRNISVAATYQVEQSGTVLVTIPGTEPDDTGSVLRLFPGRDGGTMVGTDRDPQGTELQAFVLVRQASGLSNAILGSELHGNAFAIDPSSYDVGDGSGGHSFVADGSLESESLAATVTGGSISLQESRHAVHSDDQEPDGVRVTDEASSFGASLSVASNGKVTIAAQDGSVVGAVTQDGMFQFLLTNPSSAGGDYLLVFLVRPPPPRP